MTIPISIEKLIEDCTVEQARLEYKEGWNPEAILHTICAYANDIDNWGGGYVVVGVNTEGGVPQKALKGLPLEKLDGFQRELLNICRSRIQPPYMPACEPVQYEGKHLFLIWAPGGYERPYKAAVSLAKENKEYTYYIRRYSNTVKANQSEIIELHELSGNIPFDDRINHHASLSDLRRGWMEEYLNAVGSTLLEGDPTAKELALAMRVARGPIEDIRPVNIGLMLFAERPEEFFREAKIDIVEIPDPTGEGMVEHIFKGPLNHQLEKALSYIRSNIVAEKVFKHPDKAESIRVSNYPYPAIEEAISNAIYHKSYQIPEPITVRVEEDRLRVISCPGPDRSITDEDIRQNRLITWRYRNRRLGEFLKELNLVEERGTGIPTILRSLERNGSEPPVIKTDKERTYFEISFAIHPAFLDESPLANGASTKKRRTREELKLAVLAVLREKGLSKNELSKHLGYKKPFNTLDEVVQELFEEGILEYTTSSPQNPKAKLVFKISSTEVE